MRINLSKSQVEENKLSNTKYLHKKNVIENDLNSHLKYSTEKKYNISEKLLQHLLLN